METNKNKQNKNDAATGSRQSVGINQGKNDKVFLNESIRSVLRQFPPSYRSEAQSVLKTSKLKGNGRKSQGKDTVSTSNVFASMCRRMEAHDDFKLKEVVYEANGRDYRITTSGRKYKVEIQADMDIIKLEDTIYNFSCNEQYDTIVELLRSLQNKNFYCVGKTILEEHAYFKDKSKNKSTQDISQTTYLEPQSCEWTENPIQQLQMSLEQVQSYINPELKKQIPQIMGVVTYFYQLYRSRNITDILASTYSFCRNKDLQYKPEDIKLLIDSYFNNSVEPQWNFIDHVKGVAQSDTKKKLVSFANCITAMYLGSGLGVRQDIPFYKQFIKSNESKMVLMGPDFVLLLLENTHYIYERLVQTCASRNLKAFFHSKSSYESYYELVLKIKANEPFLSNSEDHGFTEHEFVKDLEIALSEGEQIISRMKLIRHEKLSKMRELHNSMIITKRRVHTTTLANKDRDMPFSILIFGDTSIGKSSLVDALYQLFALYAKEPLEATDEYRYNRNPDNEYYDNFQTKHWFLYMDDIAAKLPAPGQPDNSVTEILQNLNCMGYVPTQAKLEDKGMTPMRNKLTIATTNVKHLNLWDYYTFPSAAARRFPFVLTPHVKPEFLNNDGMLDGHKCQEWNEANPHKTFPDFWTFSIDKVIPGKAVGQNGEHVKNRVPFKYKRIHSNIDLSELCRFMDHEISEHYKKLSAMRLSRNRMKQMTKCEQCRLPDGMCDHLRPQSLYTAHNHIVNSSIEPINRVIGQVPFPTTKDSIGLWFMRKLISFITLCINLSSQIATIADTRLAASALNWNTWVFSWYSGSVIALIPFINSFAWLLILYSCILFTLGFLRICTYLHSWQPTLISIRNVYQAQLRLKEKVNDMSRREFWTNLGNEIQKSYKAPVSLLSFIALVTLLYKLRKTPTLNPQSLGEDEKENTNYFKRSTERDNMKHPRDQTENKWVSDKVGITSYDAGRLTTSWQTMSHTEIIKLLERNFYYFTITYDLNGKTKKVTGGMICVKDQYFVTNKHSFRHILAGETSSLILEVKNHHSKVKKVIPITPGNFRCNPNDKNDIVILHSRSFDRHRSILEIIPTKDFVKARGSGFMSVIGEFDLLTQYMTNITYETITPDMITNNIVHGNKFWCGRSETTGFSGMCGSPHFISTSYGLNLIGIHTLGGAINGENTLCSTPLFRSEIELIISQFPESEFSVQSGDIPPYNEVIQPIKSRVSHVDFLEPENIKNFNFLGRVNFRSNNKSKVRETPICQEICELFDRPVAVGPPDMSYVPYSIGIRQHINGGMIPEELMLDAKVDFFETITSRIPVKRFDYFRPLNMKENINGIPGCKYIDSINRKTSTGFPYNTTKKKFLDPVEPDEIYQDPVMPNEQIQSDYNYMMSCYVNGKRAYPVFRGALKDEPVTWSKIERKKTRIFGGSPFAFTTIMREFFLPATKFLQEHGLECELAVGVVNDSLEWTRLARHMLKKKHHFGGDFKGYDKGMQASSIHIAMELLIDICKTYGYYTDQDIKVMYCIAADLSQALIDFDGDIFMFNNGNLSGHALTVIINCLVHSMYMRVVYRELHPNYQLSSFRDEVILVTYGDDGMMSVNADTGDFFNFDTVSSKLRDFNIGYTLPDKSDDTTKYISFSKLSFLKRQFVWDEEYQLYLAPLEEMSIFNSLTVHIPSRSVEIIDQMSDTIHSACLEYIMYGREKYENFIKGIRPIMEKHKIPIRQHMFKDYHCEILNIIKRNPVLMNDFHRQLISKEEYDEDETKYVQRMGELVPQSLEIEVGEPYAHFWQREPYRVTLVAQPFLLIAFAILPIVDLILYRRYKICFMTFLTLFDIIFRHYLVLFVKNWKPDSNVAIIMANHVITYFTYKITWIIITDIKKIETRLRQQINPVPATIVGFAERPN